MVTYASFAATLGMSVNSVRTMINRGVGPRTVSVPRYHKVFLPVPVRNFLKDERPFFVAPAMLNDSEIAILEAELGQSLQSLSLASHMIPSVGFEARSLDGNGRTNSKALHFMAELERSYYMRYAA